MIEVPRAAAYGRQGVIALGDDLAPTGYVPSFEMVKQRAMLGFLAD